MALWRTVWFPTISVIPMTTPAEYRQYAAECLQALKFATNQEVRTALVTMAQRWNELADRTERNKL